MQVSPNPQGDSWFRGKDKYRHDNQVKYRGDKIILDTNKGDDDIRVRKLEDQRYQVDVNGTHYHFTADEMRRLKIDGGRGNDRLLIDPSASDLNLRTKNIENVGVRDLGGATPTPTSPTQPPASPPQTNPYPEAPFDPGFSRGRVAAQMPPWMTSTPGYGGWGGMGNPGNYMNQFPPGFWSGYMQGHSLAESLGLYAYYNGPPPLRSMGPNPWGMYA